MRREHLARLAPVCPVCRVAGRTARPLELGHVEREEDGDVRDGALVCVDELCRREHPIIDGIPVVVADFTSWASHQLDPALRRDDLSPFLQTLIGDAVGPGTTYERDRVHLSGYAHAHFEPDGAFPDVVGAALELAAPEVTGAWLDTGCAVGGASFELARRGAELVAGVDLAFAAVRLAEQVRRTGRARYPLRRIGLVYEQRDVEVAPFPADRVGFWCADVAILPFANLAFDGALSLNVLDCSDSPLGHLVELGRVLREDAPAALSTPYDWSANATAPGNWIGGHSQRGGLEGSGEATLRRILRGKAGIDPRLEVVGERDRVPWRIRAHDRSTVHYELDLLALRRVPGAAPPQAPPEKQAWRYSF